MSSSLDDVSSKKGILQKINSAGRFIRDDFAQWFKEQPVWGYITAMVSFSGTLKLMEDIGQSVSPSLSAAFGVAAPVSLAGNGLAAFAVVSALQSSDENILGVKEELTRSQKIKSGIIYGAVSAVDIFIACAVAYPGPYHWQDENTQDMSGANSLPAHIIENNRLEFCDDLASQNTFKFPENMDIARQCPQIILSEPGL